VVQQVRVFLIEVILVYHSADPTDGDARRRAATAGGGTSGAFR
jgi:hypothetical protein